MKEPNLRKGATDKQLTDLYIKIILDMRKHGIESETWTKNIPTEELEKMLGETK